MRRSVNRLTLRQQMKGPIISTVLLDEMDTYGYVSDYDVLVIVNKEELVEEFDIWSKAEEKIVRRIGRPLGLIVHAMQGINQRLHEGQYFLKTSAKKAWKSTVIQGAENQRL